MMNSGQGNSSQPTSLTTLIGYITGPKAEQPNGIRVVEPPPGTRQYQRGNLYIVVEVAGDHPEQAKIVDHLLSIVQRGYYSLKGSQSQVMLGALKQAQNSIAQINAQYPEINLRAGILSAALLNGRLLVATLGPAFALVRTNDKVHMFPSEINTITGSAADMGNSDLEIFHEVVADEDVIFVGGGSWLHQVPIRTLASVVAFTNAENCADAADELYDQSDQAGLPGLLIVLERGTNSPASPPTGTGPSTGSGNGPRLAPRPRRPRLGGLPTALSATPPMRSAPAISASQSPPSTTGPPGSLVATLPITSSVGAISGDLVAESTSADTPRDPMTAASTAPGQTAQDHMIQPPPGAGSVSLDTPSQSLSESDNPTVVAAAPSSGSMDSASVSPNSVGGAGGSAGVLDDDLAVQADASLDSPTAPRQVTEKVSAWAGWVGSIGAASVARSKQFVAQMLPEKAQFAEPNGLGDDLGDDAVLQMGGAGVAGVADKRVDEYAETAVDVYEDVAAVSLDHAMPVVAQAALLSDAATAVSAGDSASVPAVDDVGATAVDALPQIEPFSPPEPASGARARLLILVSIVILAIVPAVVAVVYWGEGMDRSAEAAQLTAAAEASLIGAQVALDLGNKANARENLTDAQEYLTRAIELDSTNERRNQLAAEIEAELQEVLQLVPLYSLAEPLVTFSGDARPHRVLVVGEEIYVLDSGRQIVLRYELDPASGYVEDGEGQVILRQEDVVGGSTVGSLADMAWLPLIPGFEDRPSLLILDRNNNVFRYDPRVEGASRLDFAGQSEWRSASQIQTYLGRIYLVDETAGEIYRYSPGQYATPPELWFSDQTQVNLAGVIATEIDGDIWMLFSNGMMLRYRAGEQVPFSIENSVGIADEPVDMYVTTQDRALIYLVDAAQDRIMVYNKDGSYQYQLVAPEEQMLRGLSSVYIDEVGGALYILTQTALFKHPLPE